MKYLLKVIIVVGIISLIFTTFTVPNIASAFSPDDILGKWERFGDGAEGTKVIVTKAGNAYQAKMEKVTGTLIELGFAVSDLKWKDIQYASGTSYNGMDMFRFFDGGYEYRKSLLKIDSNGVLQVSVSNDANTEVVIGTYQTWRKLPSPTTVSATPSPKTTTPSPKTITPSPAVAKIVEIPAAKLVVNGKSTILKDKPIFVGKKLYLSIKSLAVNIGIKDSKNSIIIDSSKKQYTLVQGNNKLMLKLNDKKATMNGKVVNLDYAPILYKNDIYLPADTVSKLFGKKIIWNETSGTIAICSEASFKIVKDILLKADKVMNSVKYKDSMTTNKNLGNTAKSTLKSIGDADPNSKILHRITSTSQLDVTLGVTLKEEIYSTEKYEYKKTSKDEIWTKTASKGYSSNALRIKGLNIDFISASLVANTNNSMTITLEGDVEILSDYSDVMKDKTYKCHTKITIGKNNYYVNEMKWNSSGATKTNNVSNKYSTDTIIVFSDLNGNFEVKIPEELVNMPVK